MSKTYSDPFTRANGTLGSVPGGPAWEVLAGTWTVTSNKATSSTAPGSNPIAVIPIGLRSNGKNDVEVSTTPGHVYGNALYARVVDANNWIRVRVRSYTSTYQYYNTEHLYNDNEWMDNYQPRVLQREVKYPNGCTYGTWSAWTDNGVQTACRLTAPTDPADQLGPLCGLAIHQGRYVVWTSTGCPSGQTKYKGQSRDRTESQAYANKWVNDGYSLGSGESFTGNTQVVNNGTQYGILSNDPATSNPGQKTTPTGAYDLYLNTTVGQAGQYWATSPESVGPADTDTGSTRQAGPYTGTNYYYGSLVLEKCVAGAITTLGSYDSGNSSPQALKLRAVGSALSVYWGGTLRISATDGANSAGQKVGIGGGTSEYNPTTPNLDDFLAVAISPEKVRVAGAWVTANRKIRVAGAWVDYDTKVK